MKMSFLFSLGLVLMGAYLAICICAVSLGSNVLYAVSLAMMVVALAPFMTLLAKSKR
jgi:hypothetical protein